MRARANRGTIAVTVAAALSVAAGAGSAVAWRQTQAESFFGASARQVADALRCADHVSTRSRPSGADYRDQGTCRLGSYWVKITTFATVGPRR